MTSKLGIQTNPLPFVKLPSEPLQTELLHSNPHPSESPSSELITPKSQQSELLPTFLHIHQVTLLALIKSQILTLSHNKVCHLTTFFRNRINHTPSNLPVSNRLQSALNLGATHPIVTLILYMLQKRILRILTFSNYDVPSEFLFWYTNILPLCKLVHYRISIMMYKYANGLLPSVSIYTVNSDIHEHNTRQNIFYILIKVPPTNLINPSLILVQKCGMHYKKQ